jgi:DNA mismatch repair protein MutS2
MPFAPGDRVHIPRMGTGVVFEVRSGGRVVIEIKGRRTVVAEAQVQHAQPERAAPRKKPAPTSDAVAPLAHAAASMDLHGKTVDEAVDAVDSFINDALLAAHEEVRIIHGRSGGRIKDAVHKRLRALPPVRSFRLDPRNPGVTIVTL